MNDAIYPGKQSDKNWKVVVIDLPLWLDKAIEQKNPRVTLPLAYSIPLEYDDLDDKLLHISALN